MRGHIIKRYKDSYTIVINLGADPATGKRRQQWYSVKGTKKEAEKKLSDLLHQLDNGAFMKPAKTTLGEFLKRWLNDYVQPNLSPRTAEGYEHIIRKHLGPALGNITLQQLKAEHLQRYYSEKISGGLNAQTVRHHHTALHKALHTAVEWGVLSRNVADAVSSPRVQRPEMKTWCEDDVTRFLEAARPTRYYALFYTALFTGMRRSELLALRWQDIDFLFCQISVNRTLHQLKDGSYVFTQPKSERSRRTIALSPSAILTLQKHKEKQVKEKRRKAEKSKELYRSPVYSASASGPVVVKLNRFADKPMNFNEAREELKSLSHDFLAFRNTETKEVNVVYKKKDDFDLLRPQQELTPNQAMAELQRKGENIIIFNNLETNGPAIIFRRKSGNFGLIEPEF